MRVWLFKSKQTKKQFRGLSCFHLCSNAFKKCIILTVGTESGLMTVMDRVAAMNLLSVCRQHYQHFCMSCTSRSFSAECRMLFWCASKRKAVSPCMWEYILLPDSQELRSYFFYFSSPWSQIQIKHWNCLWCVTVWVAMSFFFFFSSSHKIHQYCWSYAKSSDIEQAV